MNMMKKLRSSLAVRVDVSDALIKTVGIFGVISFPLFYLIYRLLGNQDQDTEFFFLRLMGFLICIPLLLINYWPISARRYKTFYWYCSICYCFPFFSTYMFIENYGSGMWFTKVIVGLLWVALITDWLTFLIILPAGVFLGWLAYYLINGSIPIQINGAELFGLSINYIWVILICTVFSRSKDNFQAEKLTALKSLAGTIAHEMRTPLSTIRSSANAIKKFLPTLVDGYRKAEAAGADVQPISESNLHHLPEIPDNLDKVALSSLMVIDMLLMNLKDVPISSKHFEMCSINACIAEMFHEYPLMKQEKSLISWKGDADFTFYGNTLLTKHVLFNLLKNALYYVKAANKGHKESIFLWTETTERGNFLYFKDTGKGMPPSMVSHIFDPFYTKTRHGTGIGLAFSKSVMNSFGGTISCESTEGEHTTFILKFPKPRQL